MLLPYYMLIADAAATAITPLLPMLFTVIIMLLFKSTHADLFFKILKLRVALGRSALSYRTSPSKRPRRHSASPGRRSASLSPTPEQHESPHKKQRSRSPLRRGKHQRDASSRKLASRGEGPFFRSCTGTAPSGICAVCLGRYEHNFSKCNSSKLWDGTKGWARKNEQGRLATPEGLVLCFDWQLPKACTSTAHTEKHLCSGCGDSKHGAQKCPRGEKA